MRKEQYLGSGIFTHSNMLSIGRPSWREYMPYLLLGIALLLMFIPFGNAHATTLNVCYKTGSELDLDKSANVNTRAKLTNAGYFGASGTAAPEDFSFTTLGTISAATLASCDIYFGGGSPQLNTTEATAVKTWVQAGSRFLIAGCDYSSNNVCSTFGRGLTGNSNGGVSIVSSLSYNPLACGGALSVGTYGGASTYHGTLAGDEILATHDGAPAGQTGAAITDGLVTPTFLFTADADMYGSSGSSAIGAGATASTDQAKLVVNSFKYAADAIGGRLVSPQCFASYDNTADLAISSVLTNSALTVGDQTAVSFTVTNETANAVTNVAATIGLPSGISYVSQTGTGSYSDASKIWTIGALGGNSSATITLTIEATGVVASNITAEITDSSLADTDSSTNVGFGTDDKNDGLADDDETIQAITSAPGWPTPPVTGPGDGGECVLTHHTNSGVQADANSFYNISDHTNPSTLIKIGPWNVASGTVEGLTANVAAETFYALNANRGGKLWLGELDPVTGSFSDITTTGSATISHSSYGSLSIHQSRAIAHQPGTNELWVAAYDAQPTSGPSDTYVYLFKISTATGEVLTGAFSGEDYMAIDLAPYTFNSSNDKPSVEALTFYKNEPDILYGVLSTLSGGSPKVGHLFAIDVSLVAPQAVLAPNNLSGVAYSGGAAPSSDHYDIEGMSFDQNGDLVIVSSNVGGTNANSLLTVDLATGTASNKRSIISGDWEGIVCDPFLPGKDYGDAPVTGTAPDTSSAIAYGSASHIVVSGTYLGAGDPDSESSNQPSTNADGDGSDDADGVVIPNMIQGMTSTITATVSGAGGYLQAWIDFDGNGVFDAGEQIATDIQDGGVGDADGSANGAISLDVATPSSATTNQTYARFRWSTTAGLDSTSTAADGEVEDYALTITTPASNFSCTSKVDLWFANDESGSVSPTEFVDARDFIYLVSDEFYHSFADGAQGGLVGWAYSAAPKNVIMPLTETFYDQGDTGLASTGTSVDGDGNGVRENYTAKVDTTGGTHLSNATQGVADLVNAGNGRRTGVPQVAVFLTDAPFSQINNVSGNGGGTAWEAAAANLRNAGPDGVRIAVVLLAEAAQAYDNNAASRATIDSVIGNDGIVIKTSSYALAADPAESYIQQTVDQICGVASFAEYDFGDAPVSGPAPDSSSTNNYGETSHLITTGVYLGSSEPDADTANQPTSNADGDDADGSDDEDGIILPTLTQGETDTISALVIGAGGYLQGWVDFDGNGTFDAGEQIATNFQDGGTGDTDGLTNGTIVFDVDVPMTAVTAQTYARFRWSTTQDLDTITLASDGEIEDYALSIELGGFPVKGRVFIDTDVDGINDAAEKGVSDLPVVLLKVESNPANNTCVSVRTDAEGNYEFFPVLPGNYQLYEASLETVTTPQNCDVSKAKDPAGYRSTTNNVLAQFAVVDAEITGKDFGDVKIPSFKPDNVGTVLPGNVVFYAHEFVPSSTGSVSFSSANSTPATSGWSQTLYQDTDCNGQLNGGEGAAPVTTVGATAGTAICLINKVYAPSNVSAGEDYGNVIAADFTFGNPANTTAGTISLNVTDLTKAAANDGNGSSRLELKKTVQTYRGAPLSAVSAEAGTQNAAQPGDTLRYRIYYSNTGDAPLTDLVINDVVPAFTTLAGSPECELPLPASLTSCTPLVSGSDVTWTFLANDELSAGEGGMVSYDVTID